MKYKGRTLRLATPRVRESPLSTMLALLSDNFMEVKKSSKAFLEVPKNDPHGDFSSDESLPRHIQNVEQNSGAAP